MSLEIRLIFLSEEEILKILRVHAEKTGNCLPSSEFLSLNIEKRKGSLYFKVISANCQTVRNYYEREIMAALLVVFRAMNIPIPRAGRKSLRMIGGKIAMMVKHDVDLAFKADSLAGKRLTVVDL